MAFFFVPAIVVENNIRHKRELCFKAETEDCMKCCIVKIFKVKEYFVADLLPANVALQFCNNIEQNYC